MLTRIDGVPVPQHLLIVSLVSLKWDSEKTDGNLATTAHAHTAHGVSTSRFGGAWSSRRWHTGHASHGVHESRGSRRHGSVIHVIVVHIGGSDKKKNKNRIRTRSKFNPARE